MRYIFLKKYVKINISNKTDKLIYLKYLLHSYS